MNDKIRVLFLLTFLALPAHAVDAPSGNDELVEIARTFKVQTAGASKKERLDKLKSELKPVEAQRKRFALLLEGFLSLEVDGDVKKAQAVQALLTHETDLSEWEGYCLRVLQTSIEGKLGKRSESSESIDWLCENIPVLESGKKTNMLCAALIEGLEKGKGPFEAGLQLSKAGNLVDSGREEDAKALYRAIMEEYPESGWAISARNRLNHLKNKNSISEMMEQETRSRHTKKQDPVGREN